MDEDRHHHENDHARATAGEDVNNEGDDVEGSGYHDQQVSSAAAAAAAAAVSPTPAAASGGHFEGASYGHAVPQHRPVLVPQLGKTPRPTPTIFEWKMDVQRRMASLHSQVDSLKVGGSSRGRSRGSNMGQVASSGIGASEGGGETVQDGQDETDDAFRLTEEFEDEETRFQRRTTKIAIDAAHQEAERAISASNVVGKQCAGLQERFDALESKYERDMKENAKTNAELVSQVNRLMAEKQILKDAVKSLEEESKANDKRFTDLEDVIFFLQDEIGKVQESVSKPKSAAKPSTAAGPRAGGAKALPAAPPKKKK